MSKPQITIHLGASKNEVTVEDKGVTRTFDRSTMARDARNKLRRMVVQAWEVSRS